MPANKLSRRSFLTAMVGVSGAALLAACAPAAAPTAAPAAKKEEPTKAAAAPTAKPAEQKAQEIKFLCRADIKTAYGVPPQIEAWNKDNASKVTMDEPAAGADVATKVQAAQAAGDLIWDGFAVMETPWATVEWVKRGIIAPLDDFIAASKVPNASKVVPGIIPTIKEAVSYQGKQYGIPGNVGSVALAWFWEPLKAAGFDKQPATWDEVETAAKGIKKAFPNLTPFGTPGNGLCDLFALLWSAKENPIDADGLIDIRSEESIKALTWMRKMVDQGLLPANNNETWANWLKGGVAMINCFDVAGTMAQATFGKDKADTGINIFPEKGKTNAGTPFWINSCVLFNKAKNPQGMVDFYLYWFGPDNKANGKQIATIAAKPCYQYTYDEFIKGQADVEWELKGIDLVAKSKWFPVNSYWGIENAKIGAWIQKAMDPNQKFDPKATMDGAYKEIKDEIAKQKL